MIFSINTFQFDHKGALVTVTSYDIIVKSQVYKKIMRIFPDYRAFWFLVKNMFREIWISGTAVMT